MKLELSYSIQVALCYKNGSPIVKRFNIEVKKSMILRHNSKKFEIM
jgi:hypothetical protein